MKIQAIGHITYNGLGFNAGTIFECDDKSAAQLLAARAARIAPPAPAPPPAAPPADAGAGADSAAEAGKKKGK